MGWFFGSVTAGALIALLVRVIRYGFDRFLGVSLRGLGQILRRIAGYLFFILIVYTLTAAGVLFLLGMACLEKQLASARLCLQSCVDILRDHGLPLELAQISGRVIMDDIMEHLSYVA